MAELIEIENEGEFIRVDTDLIPREILNVPILLEVNMWQRRFSQYPPGQAARNSLIIFVATFKNQALMAGTKAATFDFIHDSWYMVDGTWQKESWRCRARLLGTDEKPEYLTFTELNKRGGDGWDMSELQTDNRLG